MFVTNRIFLPVCLFSLCFWPADGRSFDEDALDGSILDNEVAAIYGKACEKFKAGEPKSSARVRVIDKASYAAVDGLSMLDDFRSQADPQDYNIAVYDLIDNAIEDLSVRTLKQDDTDICVEVTGYVSKRNIRQAIKNSCRLFREIAVLTESTDQERQHGQSGNAESIRILGRRGKMVFLLGKQRPFPRQAQSR